MACVGGAMAMGILIWGGGCGLTEEEAEGGGIWVMGTVGMVTDVVREVAGERARVAGLIGEGIDPHAYRATRGDLLKLGEADVIFYNGLQLEGRMGEVLRGMSDSGKRVRAFAEALSGEEVVKTEGEEDPHIWMDVMKWAGAIEMVVATLTAADPAGGEYFSDRGKRYAERLKALDRYVRQAVLTVPEERRVLITAHDAFGYFGRAYGFEVKGIQGLSTESEAGVRDIEDLVDELVTRRIGAVFVESSVADKNVRALVEGTRARGHEVVIGGELFSDAMGASGTWEGTYVGMIDHNVTTIVRALGGSAMGFREWQQQNLRAQDPGGKE